MSKRQGGYAGGSGQASKIIELAVEFVGAVFLFWFLGRLVDNWLGTEPWMQVVGSVVGWAGGTFHVYLATKRMGDDAS